MGRQLFNDSRLSRDYSVSCASCHEPARAFADSRTVSVGAFGRRGRRNAPSLVNPSLRAQGKGRCALCHAGPTLTDERFHNTGVAWANGRFRDEGRFEVTSNAAERGAFKTPSLREVAHTAPYMHDGTIPTLERVVDFYDEGGRVNPYLDPELRRLGLTLMEKRGLISFLSALSGRVRHGR